MDALILKYGEPTNKGPLVLKMNPKAIIGEECLWDLQTVLIRLYYNDTKDEGGLGYTYVPIYQERIKKEKEAAQKTKDSL